MHMLFILTHRTSSRILIWIRVWIPCGPAVANLALLDCIWVIADQKEKIGDLAVDQSTDPLMISILLKHTAKTYQARKGMRIVTGKTTDGLCA